MLINILLVIYLILSGIGIFIYARHRILEGDLREMKREADRRHKAAMETFREDTLK